MKEGDAGRRGREDVVLKDVVVRSRNDASRKGRWKERIKVMMVMKEGKEKR